MDIKTKKTVRAEIVSLLKERSVLNLHGDQGVIKSICRKYGLDELVDATTIANLFHSTKEYESEVIDPKFPYDIRISSRFVNDLNKTKGDKFKHLIFSQGISLAGLIIVAIGVFVDYKLSGSGMVFWKDKGIIIAGILISAIGLVKR